MADPVLERYVFVPNETSLTTEESVRVNMQIILENLGGTKIKVYEVFDEETGDRAPLAGIVFDVLNDQPLIQPEIVVLTKKSVEIPNVTVQEGFLPKEKDATLVIVTNISSRAPVSRFLPNPHASARPIFQLLQQAFEAIKDNAFILSREPKEFAPSSNIETITTHSTPEETLILFRKTQKQPTPTTISISNSAEFDWLRPLQEAVSSNAPVVVYAQGNPQSGVLGLVNCLRREPAGKGVSCVFVADEVVPEFDVTSEFYKLQLKKGLAVNVFKDGTWGTYRHLLLEGEGLVEREHCYVNAVTKGDLSSLSWIEGHLTTKSQMETEKELVHVSPSGL